MVAHSQTSQSHASSAKAAKRANAAALGVDERFVSLLVDSFYERVREFAGNPMAKHMAIPGLGKLHFARWLELSYEPLRAISLQPGPHALVGQRARAIADRLITGIAIRRDGLSGSKAGRNLPHV